MSEHDGHRRRIIEKLDSGSLREHELLEILLFNAVPRRNTNDLAHRLLATFGSIRSIFSASMARLRTVDGIGENVAAYLFCIGRFYEKYYEAPKEPLFPQKFESKSFMEFIAGKYAPMDSEVLDFYFIEESRKIIFCKRFSTDDPQRVSVAPEELTRLLVECKPFGMVAVHNHLTNNSFPSGADDKTTYQLQLICSYHNVLFCDHFIYSRAGIYSYYRSGRMKEISESFSIGSILKKGV